MKSILPFALLAVSLALTACHNRPDDPHRPAGFILAGERSDDIVWEYFASPLQTGMYSHAPFTFTVDATAGLTMTFESRVFASGTYPLISSTSISHPDIEIAKFNRQDTIWECREVNMGSSGTRVRRYNRWVPDSVFCHGQLTVLETPMRSFPAKYRLGERIDENLTWESGTSYFEHYYLMSTTYLSVWPFGQTDSTITTRIEQPYWNGNAQQYLGFRYLADGVWKYGYLLLDVLDGQITLNAYGRER